MTSKELLTQKVVLAVRLCIMENEIIQNQFDNIKKGIKGKVKKEMQQQKQHENEQMQRAQMKQRYKKIQVQQKLKRIYKRKQQRTQLLQQVRKVLKGKQQALFKKIQKRYQKDMAKLQKQKQLKNQQIAQHSRPGITLQDILEHQKRYNQILQKCNQSRQRHLQQIRNLRYNAPQGSSIIRQNLYQQQRIYKKQQQKLIRIKELNKQKQDQFIKKVRQQHSHSRLGHKNKQLSLQIQPKKKSMSLLQIKQAGLAYLKHSKEMREKGKQSKVINVALSQSHTSSRQILDYMKHHDSSSLRTAKLKEKLKQLDEIAQQKQLKNNQKIAILHKQAQQMNEQAKQREKWLSQKNDDKIKDEMTSFLLQSVRAKTNLLKLAKK